MAEFVLLSRSMLETQNPIEDNGNPVPAQRSGKVELTFRFECDDVDQFGARYALDISRGGVFIRTCDLLPLASAVILEMQFRNGGSFFNGEGLVSWSRQPDPTGQSGEPGMGIRFTKMSPESHRNLTRILAVKEAEERVLVAIESDDEGDGAGAMDDEERTAVAKVDDIRAVMTVNGLTEDRVPEASVDEMVTAAVDTTTEMVPAPVPSVATAMVTVPVLLESTASVAASEAAAPVPSVTLPSEAAVTAAVPVAPTVPNAASKSLSQPVPLLPDWAFASSRVAMTDPVVGGEGEVAVPHHVGDDGADEMGSSAARDLAFASAPSRRSATERSAARDRTGLVLAFGGAVVLLIALALAPKQKSVSVTPERVRTSATVAPDARSNRAVASLSPSATTASGQAESDDVSFPRAPSP